MLSCGPADHLTASAASLLIVQLSHWSNACSSRKFSFLRPQHPSKNVGFSFEAHLATSGVCSVSSPWEKDITGR